MLNNGNVLKEMCAAQINNSTVIYIVARKDNNNNKFNPNFSTSRISHAWRGKIVCFMDAFPIVHFTVNY